MQKHYINIRLFFITCCLCLATTLSAQKWTKETNVPSARDAAFSFSIGDKCYFGGGGLKDFWEYDPASDTWTKKATIPGVVNERDFGVGFAIGNKGYVGMGADGTANLKKDFYQYDPIMDTWLKKADYPALRDALGFFVIGGKAYVGGGTDNVYIYADFYMYDTASNTWTKKADMPNGATAFPVGFTLNDTGYFAGGAGSTEYSTLYKYDAANDKWIKKANYPGAARQAAVGFTIGNKAYVGLGMSQYTTVYNDFYAYDAGSDKWTKAPDFPASGQAWATATAVNGKAFVGSGWDFGSSFNATWYKFVADTATGIEANEFAATRLFIYPNPASEMINIQLPVQDKGNYTISDLSGKISLCGIFDGVTTSIPVGRLAKGVYIIRMQSAERVINAKLIKE